MTEPGEDPSSDPAVPVGEGGGTSTRRYEWMKHIGVHLTTALIALVAGLGGSVIGAITAYNAATGTEVAKEVADRDTARRAKSGEVYLAYLDAANRYALATQKMANDWTKATKDPNASADFSADLDPWKTARSNFQGEVNQVYVYGSQDAWDAHQKVAATLPPSVGMESANDIVKVITGFNFSAFGIAYQGFLAVFCREVPAVPKANC